jgi:hypothetical protein
MHDNEHVWQGSISGYVVLLSAIDNHRRRRLLQPTAQLALPFGPCQVSLISVHTLRSPPFSKCNPDLQYPTNQDDIYITLAKFKETTSAGQPASDTLQFQEEGATLSEYRLFMFQMVIALIFDTSIPFIYLTTSLFLVASFIIPHPKYQHPCF